MPRKEKQERGTSSAEPLSKQQRGADTRADQAKANAAAKAAGHVKRLETLRANATAAASAAASAGGGGSSAPLTLAAGGGGDGVPAAFPPLPPPLASPSKRPLSASAAPRGPPAPSTRPTRASSSSAAGGPFPAPPPPPPARPPFHAPAPLPVPFSIAALSASLLNASGFVSGDSSRDSSLLQTSGAHGAPRRSIFAPPPVVPRPPAELLPPPFLGGRHPTARPFDDKKRGKGPDGAQYPRGEVSSSRLQQRLALSLSAVPRPTKYITIHYILHCITASYPGAPASFRTQSLLARSTAASCTTAAGRRCCACALYEFRGFLKGKKKNPRSRSSAWSQSVTQPAPRLRAFNSRSFRPTTHKKKPEC